MENSRNTTKERERIEVINSFLKKDYFGLSYLLSPHHHKPPKKRGRKSINKMK